MYGRFTQHYTWAQIHEFLSVIGAPQNLQARYNIAPTTLVDMVRDDAEGRRELVRGVRWGLIPNWWRKPLKDLPAMFNPRIETGHEKCIAAADASCLPQAFTNGQARRRREKGCLPLS